MRTARLLSLLLSCLLALVSASAPAAAQWLNPPRLHNPTWSSVTLAAVPAVDLEVRLASAPDRIDQVRAGTLWSRVARAPDAVVVETRPALSSQRWVAGPELTLRALPGPEAASVKVAVASDTHAWALQSVASPQFTPPSLRLVQQAMDNVVAGAADLLVHNGDFTMTWCSGCQPLAPAAGAGSAGSLADALQRTRTVWGTGLLGRAGSVPALTVAGDHEGLMPWLSTPGAPNEFLGMWSAQALARTVPHAPSRPEQGYLAGPPGTLSWALRSGELLLVGLDVHTNATLKPASPDDWQLTPAHLAWLDAVLAIPADHKVVVAEHILGGLAGPESGHWKGRSSIKATDDGTVEGTFTGGHALVHALLVEHGVDVYLVGHDHVAAWGVKDGVGYLSGGRAGGISSSWHDAPWFREALDYDGDGVPEYETGVTGSRRPGHVELEAIAGGELIVTYVRASNGAANGSELLRFVLPP